MLALVLPALAIVVAGLAALFSGAGGARGLDDGQEPEPDPEPEPEPELGLGIAVGGEALSARTMTWAAELDAARGSVPLAFLLRWVQIESDGDPEATGASFEVGIGQVDTQDGPQYGYTREQLHSANVDRAAQVGSLVAMASAFIAAASNRLAARTLSWRGEPDILCLAKMVHGLPVLTTVYLSDAAQKGQADSWADFRAYLETLPRADAVALYRDIGRYYPLSRFTRNASLTATGVA